MVTLWAKVTCTGMNGVEIMLGYRGDTGIVMVKAKILAQNFK